MYKRHRTAGKDNILRILVRVLTKTIFNVRARAINFKMNFWSPAMPSLKSNMAWNKVKTFTQTLEHVKVNVFQLFF